MFLYTSPAIGRGAFVSAMRFKFSSVTEPRTSDVAKASYPEQNTFALISQRAFFQAVQKVLTIQVPLLRASAPRDVEHEARSTSSMSYVNISLDAAKTSESGSNAVQTVLSLFRSRFPSVDPLANACRFKLDSHVFDVRMYQVIRSGRVAVDCISRPQVHRVRVRHRHVEVFRRRRGYRIVHVVVPRGFHRHRRTHAPHVMVPVPSKAAVELMGSR